MAERISLSKKIRFDVFKRDGFCCQYCGNTPPTIVLECDHIIPVSKGGPDDIDNLITSCFDCNRGKSNIELNILPQKTSEKAELIQEKEEQYKAYKKLLSSIEKRIKKEMNKVDAVYSSYFPEYILSDGFRINSLKKFIVSLGLPIVEKAMNTACYKIKHKDGAIKYFCAICWNKMRGE